MTDSTSAPILQLLVIGATIIAKGPFTITTEEIISSDCIYPKSILEGYQILDTSCPEDLDINAYWVQAGSIVPRPAKLPNEAELITLKDYKRAEINSSWDSADNSTFSWSNKSFNCDAQAKNSINGVATNILLIGTFPENFPGAWKCADNTFVMMDTVEKFKSFYAAMTKQGTLNFIHAQDLKQQLEAITSVDAWKIPNINW